jgi:phosphoglycerate dehydrogenase-like enzyme
MVCVPLTDETRGSIGERELRLLPEGAVLVNVARGPVVDEDALYEALADGHLHSAGLDVWYRYPGKDGDPENTRPSNRPFEELPNVVMSPHRGGWLHGIEAHRMRDLAALLNALANGTEAPGRVDPAAGY